MVVLWPALADLCYLGFWWILLYLTMTDRTKEELNPTKVLYHDLHHKIGKNDFEKMLDLTEDLIGKSESEEITKSYKLFSKLEEKGHIGPGKFDLIIDLFKKIRLPGLILMVEDFEKSKFSDKEIYEKKGSPAAGHSLTMKTIQANEQTSNDGSSLQQNEKSKMPEEDVPVGCGQNIGDSSAILENRSLTVADKSSLAQPQTVVVPIKPTENKSDTGKLFVELQTNTDEKDIGKFTVNEETKVSVGNKTKIGKAMPFNIVTQVSKTGTHISDTAGGDVGNFFLKKSNVQGDKGTYPSYLVRSLDGRGDDTVGPFDAPHGVWFAQNNGLIAVNTGRKKTIDIINPDFVHKESIVPVSPLTKAFCPWDVVMCNDQFFFSDTANRCVVVWDKCEGFTAALGVEDDIDPRGITAYQRYVVVTDVKNHEVLKYERGGRFVKKVGGKGKGNGKFFFPASVTVDSKKRLLVSDKYNNRVQVLDFDDLLFKASFGTASGDGQLSSPQGISVDIDDNVYVCDTGNRRIVKYDSSGNWLYNIGETALEAPLSIAVRQSGSICIAVAELSKNRIKVFSEVKEMQ